MVNDKQKVRRAQERYERETTGARERRREAFREAAEALSRRQIAEASGLSVTRVQQIIDGE